MRWLIGLTLVALATAASAAPTVEALKLTAPPTLDGKLDEACWQGAPQLSGFTRVDNGAPATAQTQAWVATDADALYVAVKALEPKLDQLKATVTDRDSSKLFGDDTLEIFVDANHDRFHFVQFACNPLGTQADVQGDAAGASLDWDGVWQVATGRLADGWTAEFRLPWATLGMGRAPGKVLGFNLCRERVPERELSYWAPTGGKFIAPQAFGEVKCDVDLTPYRLDLAVSDWGKGLWGRNELVGKLESLGTKGRELSLRLEVASPHEKPRVSTRDRFTLAGGGSRTVTVGYQFFQEGLHSLSLTVLERGTDRVVAAVGRTVEVSALADLRLFKSFYSDDVKLCYQINVPAEEVGQYRLSVELTPEGKPDVLATHQLSPVPAVSGELRLDTGKLPMGRYAVACILLGKDGEVVVSKTLLFPELRDRGVTDRTVTIRRGDHMLVVQGKPFFPLGIYESPGTTGYLKRLRDAGFNLCLSHGLPGDATPGFLDMLQAEGMKVWVPVSSTMDFSSDSASKRQKLTELVQRAGNHPALLMWESIDEPAWGSQDADGLYEGYCFLRALDQQRPIWTNHAPRNLISTLAYYNRATDIAGCDIYPVPVGCGHSNLPNSQISVVGDETDKNLTALGGDKPVFMVLQGFGWAELSKRPPNAPPPVMPTFAESRFMAYDAIVHGATGVLYWGTHYTAKPSRFWSELRSLVSELAALQDVLAAPPYTGDDRARLQSETPGVRLLHKRLDSGNYVIVVNENTKAVQARVLVPTIYAGKVRRLFEDQTLPLKADQVLTVPLEPFDVAVLSDDNVLRDERKDFSAEWRNQPNTAQQEAALTEPGNVLRNGGFEVDADGDDLPDAWAANVLLSATLTDREKHGGLRSLALTSPGVGVGPLMVERNLALKADGKYRFTAWVKCPDPDTEFRFYVEWVLGGKWLGKALPWSKGKPEWQQITLDFAATPDPQGGAYAVVQMRGKGTVYFDDLKIEALP